MNQVVKVCASGLVGGATVCATAPAWAAVTIVAIVTGAATVITKSQQKRNAKFKLFGHSMSS